MPHEHDKTSTITAALPAAGLVVNTVCDGATNSMRLRAYITDTLAPAFKASDTVILDNLNAYKVKSVREAIGAVAARLTFSASTTSPEAQLSYSNAAKRLISMRMPDAS